MRAACDGTTIAAQERALVVAGGDLDVPRDLLQLGVSHWPWPLLPQAAERPSLRSSTVCPPRPENCCSSPSPVRASGARRSSYCHKSQLGRRCAIAQCGSARWRCGFRRPRAPRTACRNGSTHCRHMRRRNRRFAKRLMPQLFDEHVVGQKQGFASSIGMEVFRDWSAADAFRRHT